MSKAELERKLRNAIGVYEFNRRRNLSTTGMTERILKLAAKLGLQVEFVDKSKLPPIEEIIRTLE